MDPWLLHVVSPPVGAGDGVCAAEAWCARPPHRTAAAGAQRELTHSQNELQLGGRLVLAPFEALNTEICVVSLRRASGAAGFTDTRWVELEELYEKCGGKAPLNRALKKYRDMEQGAADAAIAECEEGIDE